MDTNIKILIYSNNPRAKVTEYLIDYSEYAVADALDRYIKEKLKFEEGFAISEEAWESVKAATINYETPTHVLVELINGLCKSPFNQITKVITQNYPL